MAGHSKFKNIMHRKGAQDKKRAKLFSRLIREISVSVKLGSPDPDSNPRLRTAINNALSSNMNKDSIDKAIKKQTSNENKELIEEIVYEGFGPSGVAIIVETMTDNRNRSAAEVRSTFSKYNGNLGVNGCVTHNFKKIGIVTYKNEIGAFEDFFDFCASLNVDDVFENEDKYILETDFESLNVVVAALEKKFSIPKFSQIEWKPLNFIDVDDESNARTLDPDLVAATAFRSSSYLRASLNGALRSALRLTVPTASDPGPGSSSSTIETSPSSSKTSEGNDTSVRLCVIYA